MPKTGTHSLAAVFERYRVWHEPERIRFMELMIATPGSIPYSTRCSAGPEATLDASRSHEFRAKKKFDLLPEIDQDYLRDRVEARCTNLMRKFFPEVRGLSDIRGYRLPDSAHTAQAS